MPQMNVGDRVRYIDEQFRLADFFKLGEIYTVATSAPLWPDGCWIQNADGERVKVQRDAKMFTFKEIPGYTWTCDFFFEDVID